MLDREMLKPLIAATLAVSASSVAIAVADTGLPNIAPHRHFIQTDAGLSQVGPRVCDDPSLQTAFNQFHSNVHRAVAGSEGPDSAAPGLHNSQGGEIISKPCSFQP